MVKSWTCCLSLWVLVFGLTACAPKDGLYVKTFSNEEQLKLSNQFLAGAGLWYYQGNGAEQNLVKTGLKHNPNHAELWRELGAPHIKRGFAAESWDYYGKTVALDPRGWQGWRGYLLLYFYRDYENAIADFNATDTLSPNFVDHPQSTSVDFMRAICYLQLGQHDEALRFLEKHIADEIKVVGEHYIDSRAFLYSGIAWFRKGDYSNAEAAFRRGLKNADGRNADLWYWTAKTALLLGHKKEATEAIEQAGLQFQRGNYHYRDYVEEFFQLYPEDIQALHTQISDQH